jgi:hypothetical protein
VLDAALRKDFGWDRKCIGIETMIYLYQIGYTIQPIPKPGHLKLAAAFFDRRKFVSDNLLIGNCRRGGFIFASF